MKTIVLVLALVVGAMLVGVSASWAQLPQVDTDTLTVNGRSSFEDGYLGTFGMDRVPVGGRITAMGGAGLALLSGSEGASINPAATLGVLSPELSTEAVLNSGSATVKEFPAVLDLGTTFLQASNYRIRPKEALSYNNLSLGMPLVIFGKRGAASIAYRREAPAGPADETRVELRGPVTNQADATFGLGDLPEDSMDVISVTAAREINDKVSVGANFNWRSGTLTRDRELGVAVFGFQLFAADTRFSQDVSSFNVDVGTQIDFGPLDLAAVVYLGHDITFKDSRARINPIPDPQNLNQRLFIVSTVPGHTLSVPTMYGLGSAYEVNDRLTVAADYWIRGWANAEITRDRIDPIVGFADPSDSTSFFFLLPRIEGETETINAALENTNSLRLGLEYDLLTRDTFTLPVRLGFRAEKLTINNIAVPDTYADYSGLVDAFFQATPGSAEYLQLEQQLKDVAEMNQLLFRGDAVDAKAITLGLGVIIDAFSADLSFERVNYDYDRFFLQDFDPLLNPIPAITRESRGLFNVNLSTTMRF